MARKHNTKKVDVAELNFNLGYAALLVNPIFAELDYRVHIVRSADNFCPADGWAVVTSRGQIHSHPTWIVEPEEWTYILAHCFLHMAFGHFQHRDNPAAWNMACDYYLTRFLKEFKIGQPPAVLPIDEVDWIRCSEEELYRLFCEGKVSGLSGMAGLHKPDMLFEHDPHLLTFRNRRWQSAFVDGLARAATSALNVAAGRSAFVGDDKGRMTHAQKAQSWCISNFPLLGALAANFTIIEDPVICARLQIAVAAVDAQARQIFMNPAAGLDEEESRFVMAHELLHVGLGHQVRRGWRDPYLWNVACDYVINQWLVEMGFGDMPGVRGLLDPSLKGQSAEAIYDRIVNDMRLYRKLATLRGVGTGDILELNKPDWWLLGDGIELDEFYRRCLAQGVQCHLDQERGLLPVGLVEEIQALAQPPIPWDVSLAQWFDTHFPPIERQHSYMRANRRQDATPDIIRPGWLPAGDAEGRTFGVILDTSGSMDSKLLAKGLGAITSYCLSRDIPAVRLICCDAQAYDLGYMAPEALAGRVEIKGRGGTVLQPAVDLLENADDFPEHGPLLIITDGYCDRLTINRHHAFLMPEKRVLPFVPKGTIFRIR